MAVIPLKGDRSAHDVDNYPEKHASDLENNLPVHHVPAGGSTGDIPTWNGTKWVAQAGGSVNVPDIMTIGTYNGNLETGETPLKIYNCYGANREITQVFLSVGTAPTGAAIKVDIKVGGVSIFTGGNEPQIAIGEYTGYSVTFNDPIWDNATYITWNITQVGSTIAGADLVVHIVHEAAAGYS